MATKLTLDASGHLRSGESTRAWVLRRAEKGQSCEQGRLELATIMLPPVPGNHVLVESLYGSWEGNMTHALQRDPIDVCQRLGQDWIVLGNGGVVRVLSSGKEAKAFPEGTVCGLVPIAKQDPYGYVRTVVAYDEPGTMGVLAEQFYVKPSQLVPLPDKSIVAPVRWAGFAVRYATAWSNWRVALGAWRLQMADVPPERTHVWGWGGGVAFAELQLAKAAGFKPVMLHTGSKRAEMISAAGITPLDRAEFSALTQITGSDRKAFTQYVKAERAFLKVVDTITEGDRVSIFIDNIGGPVARATLRALGRQGVVATSGWKCGYAFEYNRAAECIDRHIFVHTHASPLREGLEAMSYAIENGWLPPVPERIYSWEEVPQLVDDYTAGRIDSYFPTFATDAAGSL